MNARLINADASEAVCRLFKGRNPPSQVPDSTAPKPAGFALPESDVFSKPALQEHIQLGESKSRRVEKLCALTSGKGVINAETIHQISTGVAIVITTLSMRSSCAAVVPVNIMPSSMRERRLETVMLALPRYARWPPSALAALK